MHLVDGCFIGKAVVWAARDAQSYEKMSYACRAVGVASNFPTWEILVGDARWEGEMPGALPGALCNDKTHILAYIHGCLALLHLCYTPSVWSSRKVTKCATPASLPDSRFSFPELRRVTGKGLKGKACGLGAGRRNRVEGIALRFCETRYMLSRKSGALGVEVRRHRLGKSRHNGTCTCVRGFVAGERARCNKKIIYMGESVAVV